MGRKREGRGLGRIWRRYGILAAVILAVGIGVDLFCQRAVLSLPSEERGRFAAAEEDLEWEGFEKTADGWRLTADRGTLTIRPEGRFVGRFGFSYAFDERMNAVWYVWPAGWEEPLVIEDHNSALIQSSTERLDRPVDKIHIVWQREDMIPDAGKAPSFSEDTQAGSGAEEGVRPELLVKEAWTVNSYEWNGYRMLFVWVTLGLAAFLWEKRRLVAERLEAGFLTAALGLGLLLIVLTPSNKVSWDEEVHFFHAYCVSHFGLEVKTNDMLERLFVADKENYPYNLPANLDERREMDETLNQCMREEAYTYSRGHALAGIYTPAYIPAALGLRLGFLLRLPFTAVYQLGRVFNLLFCAGILAWAIRKIPVGKAVLAAIGLLPTPLFLMSTYSYDAFITSMLALGFAWFLDEYLHRERTVGWPGFWVMALGFAVGSMPKAIYVPLILVIFLLPRKKFKDRRQELLMKGLAAALFLALMASFVLPTVLSPAESNDTRGGNTSEAGQIPYILSDIPRFARMLLSSIRTTFPSYTLGATVFGCMGHIGYELLGAAIPAFVLAVLFADEKRAYGSSGTSPGAASGRLGFLARGWILLLCAGVAAMVWVAMYLAFTPVGSDYIQGVQARYYIPLLLPLYLCLCPDEARLFVRKEKVYLAAVAGGALFTGMAVGMAALSMCG